MNRADRRRQAKLGKAGLEKTGGKAAGQKQQAVATMLNSIVVLLNAQRFAEAEAGLKDLLEVVPDQTEALHLYGLLLSQTDRLEQGIDHLRRATAAAPKTALYWNNLAAAYTRAGKLEEAVAAAQQAVTHDRTYAEPLLILANAQLALNQIAEGTDTLAAFLALHPADGNSWYRLGMLRSEQQRYEDARAAYEQAMVSMPENVALLRDLASAYMNTWQYDKAQKLRQKATELEAAKLR